MFKKVLAVLPVLWVLVLTSNAQSVSDFENVITKVDSFYNGSNLDQGAVSGAAHFWNSYNTKWGSWDGFSFSSMRDTATGTWANQYSSITGNGANNSMSYAVAYSDALVSFTHSTSGDSIMGLSINNSTYTYKTLLNGNSVSKKFGGTSGNDTDWFRVKIIGYDWKGKTGEVTVYLADYRFSDNSKDYILKDWTWVDLTSLGKVVGIEFNFESSDVGQWGINTPTYACIDSLVYKNSTNNFHPLAQDDQFMSYQLKSDTLNVMANDKDPGAVLGRANISIVEAFTMTTHVFDNNGAMVISKKSNAYGWDTCSYKIQDVQGLVDTAEVTLLFNDAPKANQDKDQIAYVASKAYDLKPFTNDVDEMKSKLKLSILDSGKFGSLSLKDDSIIVYIPKQSMVNDTLKYKVVDEFGLEDSALFIVVIGVDAVNEFSLFKNELQVYPNPSNSFVTVKGSSTNLNGRLSVVSLSGKEIFTDVIQGETTIDVSEFSAGLYWIRLTDNNSVYTSKFVVK